MDLNFLFGEFINVVSIPTYVSLKLNYLNIVRKPLPVVETILQNQMK